MAKAKLTDDDKRLIAARHDNGETMTELAKEYDVVFSTLKRAIERVKSGKMSTPGMPPVSIAEFKSRAHKILWRLNPGKKEEKVQYNRWEAMVEEFKKDGKMSEPQAVVQASKSFDALKPLFATCDVSSLDPHPGSHADIVHSNSDRPIIKCLDKTLTNRDNLTWAIDAAGRYLSDKVEPDECPNWTAYYLYNQARSDPTGFTGKYLSVVGKVDDGKDDESIHKAGKRSIAELNDMLDLINQKPEGETNG